MSRTRKTFHCMRRLIKFSLKYSTLIYLFLISILFIYSFYTSYIVPSMMEWKGEKIDLDGDGIVDQIRFDDVLLSSISLSTTTNDSEPVIIDPLHVDTFRTFTKTNGTHFQLPIFGYIYYNTDLEFYYHQLFRFKVDGDKRTSYISEFHHLIHLTYKLYLKFLFSAIQFVFNIEYTLFKELELFFLRFAAPSQMKIHISIPLPFSLLLLNSSGSSTGSSRNFTLKSDEYGYYYHEMVVERESYRKMFCDPKNPIEWMNYTVQILDHTKIGYILFNCDSFLPKEQVLYSVISDIDDSIKITNVTSGLSEMMKTTFNPFRAVPHINETFVKLKQSHPATNFHYVSSSPFVLYNKLESFVVANNFPLGSFHLRVSHLDNYTFFTMLKSSKISKPESIHQIIQSYPKRKFILFGDSGESDPDIYGKMYSHYPDNIENIIIRCASKTSTSCIDKVEKSIQSNSVPRNKMHYFLNDEDVSKVMLSL